MKKLNLYFKIAIFSGVMIPIVAFTTALFLQPIYKLVGKSDKTSLLELHNARILVKVLTSLVGVLILVLILSLTVGILQWIRLKRQRSVV